MSTREPVLTADEVAVWLQVLKTRVHELARAKDLPGFKVAGEWRFLESDVIAWARRQVEATAGSRPTANTPGVASVSGLSPASARRLRARPQRGAA